MPTHSAASPRRGGSPRRRAGSPCRPRRRRWRWRSASPWCRSAPPGSRRPSRTGSARSQRANLPVPRGAQQVVVGDRLVGAAAAASARRCGHSISTGGSARNSGPGKSPRRPIAGLGQRFLDHRHSARRSDRAGADSCHRRGRNRRCRRWWCAVPSIGKRLMRRMPERPAVSAPPVVLLALAERGQRRRCRSPRRRAVRDCPDRSDRAIANCLR